MKVAIIGANGFIGTRLVEYFHLAEIHTVVPVVRRPSALALSARFALDWRIADALDAAALASALAGCDAVVHAALGDPRQIEAMPAILARAAAAARVRRVVYLSSAAVHGPAPAAGTNENTRLHTHHAMDYNNAKVRAEWAFFRACRQHGLTGFALRPGIVFGPRSRWIADLADDLRRHQAWLFRDGEGICNTIYVDNLAEAVAQCLAAAPAAADAYLVGDDERVTWRDFYHLVSTGLGIDPHTIHRVDAVTTFRRTPAERVARLVASRGVQALLPLLPAGLKRTGRRAAAAFTPAAPPPDSWQLPAGPSPRITQEVMQLQQCRWRLSSDPARLQLGYRPLVDFPTAIGRSLAWLAFAEGAA